MEGLKWLLSVIVQKINAKGMETARNVKHIIMERNGLHTAKKRKAF